MLRVHTLMTFSFARGVLNAARLEVSGGWAITTTGLVSAEIFSDFLEMASYLLELNYKDPAAVVSGSVLEEHLRQLSQRSGISTTEAGRDGKMLPRKAEMLNQDLKKASVYNMLEQKSVTAWLDLRNKAAHGEYNQYNRDQVLAMLQGINDFIARNPL